MLVDSQREIVFVAGFPRSGTTWFANLINSNSEVIYRHEILGRNYSLFGEEIFNALKFDNGLSPEDFSKAQKVIFSADVNTDKPPFFPKKSGIQKAAKIHHFFWLFAKAVPVFRPIYSRMYTVPSKGANWKVLIKETRSMLNMSSIIKGLRINHPVFLIRQPHGSIASHLKGQKTGKMAAITDDFKSKWFSTHRELAYIQELSLDKSEMDEMCPAEFHAIQWRIYHEEMLKVYEQAKGVHVYFYEDFVADPEEKTKQMFAALGLEYDQSVEQFIAKSSGKHKSTSFLKDSSESFYSVYRSSNFEVEGWRNELTELEQEKIDVHCGDLFKSLQEQFNKSLA